MGAYILYINYNSILIILKFIKLLNSFILRLIILDFTFIYLIYLYLPYFILLYQFYIM